MKRSSLKRILSLICVFALALSMMSVTVLADEVAEVPVFDGPIVNVGGDVAVAELPEARVDAGTASTNEPSANLLAAKMVYNVTTDGTTGNSQFTFSSVKAQGSPSTLTYDNLTLNKAIKMESATSISFTASESGKLVLVVDGADGKGIKVDGTKYTVASNVVTVELSAGSHTITKGDVMNLYYISFGSDCDHVWGEGVETTPATCTTKGVKTFTCSKCSATKTEEIEMKAHSFTVKVSDQVEPTCYQAGKTAVMKCANCTATQGGEAIAATGAHTFDDTTGKCTTPGCAAVDPAKCQHTNQVTVEHKDATCTEPGVVGGSYCADCGNGKEAAEAAIPALQHHFVDGVCDRPGCGARESTGFIAEAGWLESAYATWAITPGVTSYTATVTNVKTGKTDPVDNQLIREYPGYMRVDALGLAAGTYTLTVKDNTGKEMTTNELTVEAHDRSGFAFINGTASGAYNEDGTLKANAEVIYVTKASDLDGKIEGEIWNNTKNKFTSNPVCVRVIGHVTMSGAMGFQGWTTGVTIEGVGNDALLTGGGVFIKGSSNMEVRNLGVMHVQKSGKNDLIAVEQTNDHVWVHNCDLFYGFDGSGDQAKGDGSLDVKDAEYCSFSYNHFWDSGKCSLLGNGSSENYITYHHNWFDHSDSRHPRTRGGDKGGNVHVYNNYYDGVSKYGVGTTSGSGTSRASVFIEANYFRNTKYPIMNSKQASDSNGSGGSNTFSGDNPGFNKVWNNVMVGSKNFVSQMDDPASFDGYVVSSRDEKVPDSVSAGGSKYNNFDTSMDLGVATVQEPKDAVITVTNYAGRVNGGDIQYDFDDTIEDTNYAVIEELNNILNSYQTKLVSVGGTVTNAVAAEHTHRPGTWLITKAPGCDPTTKKVVNGEETQYCIDCGEVLNTRTVAGAHSNDGSGVCQVCGQKVANGGGPAADPNAKILKASDFKDLAKGDAVTQDMLNAKYEGYFKSAGTGVKAGQSSSTNPVTDHLALPNTGNGGISFTVKNGPAKVTVQASSTGKGKSSVMVLKNASGTAVADKNNATNITVKENVSAATTVTYEEIPAGTYTLYSAVGENGVRLIQLAVSEAEATCEHANKTHHDAVPATCTTGGSIEYWSCADCGKNFSDEACTKVVDDVTTEELGHDMTVVKTPAVPVTCLTDGKTAVMGCSRCDHTEGGEVIQAVGHHTEATRVKPGTESSATCTTPGSFTEETYCTVCNEVLKTEEKTGVLAPHTLTKTEGKDATCVAEGNIAYWTCSECHQNFSDAEGKTKVDKVTLDIDPTAHGKTELVGAKEATTTEDGYTGNTVCTLCNTILERGTTIPKITGSMSKLLKGTDQDTNAGIQAIKTGGKDIAAKGWATDGQSFKMGGNDTAKDFFTVYYSANSKVDTTEKTWDFEGNYYTTGEQTQETRFNLGGKGDTSKMKNLIGFTTTKPATVKVWWVQAGGVDIKDDTKSGPIRNIALWNSAKTQVWKSTSTATDKNTAEFDVIGETTKLAAGTYYLGGADNSNYFFMVEVIEEGDIARTWAKPTTPVDPSCTHSNKTHTAAKDATCEAAGNIEYWSCPDCGKNFSDEACTKEVTDVTVPKLAHTEATRNKNVVEATCETAGSYDKETYCSKCGEVIKTEKVTTKPLGHDMQVTTPAVPATCTTEGKTAVLTCSHGCGKTEGGATVAKLSHTETTRVENNTGATCTTPGSYDLVTYCSVCDTVIKTEHKTDVLAPHTLAKTEAVAATCVAEGNIAYWTCSACHKTFSDEGITEVTSVTTEKDPDNHVHVVVKNAKPATETEDGYTGDKVCEDCGKTVETGTVIPAGTPEVDKAALAEAITAAESAKGTATVDTDGKKTDKSKKWVTEAEMKALTDAIDKATAVNEKSDATQTAVNEAVTELKAAVADFEIAKKAGTKPNGGGSSGGGSYTPSTPNKQEELDDQKTPLAGGPELNSTERVAYITGYADGTIGPERTITRQETAAIFYRLLTEQSKAVYGATTNSFSDIPADHWANEAISTLAKAEILKGLPDGTFGAERSITRGEFVTIVARFYQVTEGLDDPFTDVDGHWAEDEILFASSKGWVNGLPDGSFGPDKLITRAEAMRIINNVLDRKASAESVEENAKQFSDVSEDAWYYYDVMEATSDHEK